MGYRKNAFVDARQAQRCVHLDTYPSQFGYISDAYQCGHALCLEAVPDWYPPPQYPPYDYSRIESGVEKLTRSILKGFLNRALFAEEKGRFASSFLLLGIGRERGNRALVIVL